jgi:energy-coupling factor transport system permease protein
VSHRRRASPLHAARAGIGALWCVTLGLVALSLEHPLVLAVLLACVLAVAAAARVGRHVALVLAWGVPFAAGIAAVNALVVRDGLTVLLRGSTVPGLGRLDVTLEALVYGGVLGMRALIVIGCAAVLAAAVDPDELLRAVRRVSLRSGVTTAVATRMMPVLARDARRLADAQRCRGGDTGTAGRVAILRAVTAGALDRATDLAATLEVRGFGTGVRPARRRRPWSRHDLAFGASTATLAALGVLAAGESWARFEAYPRIEAPVAAGTLLLTFALVACALAPFADRRGIER